MWLVSPIKRSTVFFHFVKSPVCIIILHNDVDDPFPKANTPNYTTELISLFKRHPKASITWAHLGLGRIVAPPVEYSKFFEAILADPELNHVNFDISWDEVAKVPDSNRKFASQYSTDNQ